MNKKIIFVVCLFTPLIIGALSGVLSGDGINDWYPTLIKPSFNPPSWVFGPVWTILYILMGYSFYRIWMQHVSIHRIYATRLFIVQLILNFFWSLIFFRWHLTGLATIEIIILWISILLMIRSFLKLDRIAGYLQIPYLLWVSFATMLSASLWYLNQGH